MFDFLKGKKKEVVTITLDRASGVYYPGETVGITVEIMPDRDLKLRSAVLMVSGEDSYECHSTTSSIDADGNACAEDTYFWSANQFFGMDQTFLTETVLPGGQPQRYSFSIPLPNEGMPSFSGEIIRVTWRVRVKIERSLAKDLEAATDLIFCLPPHELSMQPGEYSGSNEPAEADMGLILPGLEFRPGQTINGGVRVLPLKDFAAEVRAELLLEETVPYDVGNSRKKVSSVRLAGNTRFVAGQQQTFPFQITIPPEAQPSFQTDYGSIVCTVKGILDRRLRKDTCAEQFLTIYPSAE